MRNIQNLFPAGQYTHKGGGEYAGPCPDCGGHDRFLCWPGRTAGRAFWCRQCGLSGDLVDALVRWGGMDMREALEAVGRTQTEGQRKTGLAGGGSSRGNGLPANQKLSFPAGQKKEPAAALPSEAWSTAAATWLAECQRELEVNADAWALLAERYLTLDTCRGAGIGWNSRKMYADRGAWGLPPGANGGDKLLLPAGLVLPVRRSGRVVGLTVRCSDPSGPRYRDVAGGAVLPFAIGKAGRPVMLVESYLDACLVWQESVGRLAAVATFGTGKAFDGPCLQFVQQAPQIFLCPDADMAGIEALLDWQELFPSAMDMRVLPYVQGVKDPTELQRAALALPLREEIPTVGEWLTGLLELDASNLAVAASVSNENEKDGPTPRADPKNAA